MSHGDVYLVTNGDMFCVYEYIENTQLFYVGVLYCEGAKLFPNWRLDKVIGDKVL